MNPQRHVRISTASASPLMAALLCLFSGWLQAAELDCLVKPQMYVDVSSPVVSVLEEILAETGD